MRGGCCDLATSRPRREGGCRANDAFTAARLGSTVLSTPALQPRDRAHDASATTAPEFPSSTPTEQGVTWDQQISTAPFATDLTAGTGTTSTVSHGCSKPRQNWFGAVWLRRRGSVRDGCAAISSMPSRKLGCACQAARRRA